MCKHWKYFCYEVDGNLGVCRLTHEWCKNNRGWFSKSKKWRKCTWYLRVYLYVRQRVRCF